MTYYTLAGVSYAPAPHPVHGIVFQKAARRKSTLNTGDTKVVNGITYTFSVTRDQLEDSITIPGGGLRFYVQRL